MRHLLRLNADRNIGFVATDSARALKVASFISLSGLFHHAGMSPQRMGMHERCPSPETTTSIKVVGQILYRACVLRAGTSRVSRYSFTISVQVSLYETAAPALIIP